MQAPRNASSFPRTLANFSRRRVAHFSVRASATRDRPCLHISGRGLFFSLFFCSSGKCLFFYLSRTTIAVHNFY